MAFPCIYTYKGKEYTAAEFRALIAKGEFDGIISIGEPPKGEPSDEGDRLSSAKNSVIDKKREAIGLNPVMKQIKTTAPKLLSEATDIIANGEVSGIVHDAIQNNRYTLSPAEQLAVAYERDNISDKYSEISKELLEARDSGDINTIRDLEAKRSVQQSLLDSYDQVLKNTGSTSGQVLWARQLFINKQLDRVTIIRNMKGNSKTGEVPQELIDQVDNLVKERDELSKKLEEYTKAYEEEKSKLRKQLEKAQVQSHAGNKGKKVETAGERAKVWADRVRKLKSKPFVFVDENGVAHDLTANGITWNDLVEKTAKAIEDVGTSIDKAVELSNRIADIVKEHPLYKKLSEKDRERLEKQLEEEALKLNKVESFESLAEQVGLDAEGELHEGLLSDIDKMFKIKVEEELNSGKSVEDINYDNITKSIFDALSEHIEGLDITELRDLISGYGKFKELSKDETVRAIAELKNQMRLDAKVEATKRGELPLRNGLERAKQTQATREKNAEILKNIKEKGIEPKLTEEEKAAAYATATELHHRRIENAIADIQKEIDENKRRQKSEPKKYTDKRSKELESDLAKLKEIRDAKFKQPVKTPEERRLESLQEKLDALLRNEVPETKDRKEDSKEVKDLKEQINKQKELLGLKPSKATPADIAINATKKAIKAIEEQIENLKQGKLEDGTPIVIGNKEGSKVFRIGGEKSNKIDNQRLRELQSLKEGLLAEVNDLLPQSVKDLAILEKANKLKQRRLDFLNSKMAKGKYDPTVFNVKKREPYQVLSKEGKVLSSQKLLDETNVKIKKAEKDLDRIQEEWRLSQRSELEKFGDLMNNIAREGAISNPTAIPKIFTSGMLTQVSRPFENLIGMPVSYLLPKAAREAATIEGKFNLKTELKAQKEFINSDHWKEAWKKMQTGKHREDILYGDKNYPEQLISVKYKGKTYKFNPYISGRMHAFAKTVPYRIGYERNRMYAYEDAILKHPEYFENGVLTQHGQAIIETQAYTHALGDAFLQNNKLSQFVRNKISEYQRSKEKSEKLKAFALNNIFKVLNVSANYFSAGLDYIPLVGNIRAQLAARSEVEMTPERANKILRQNKRGAVGIAFFALGAMSPQVFGGYGKRGEENEKGVGAGEVKFGNYELPHWLTHTPFLIPFQLGATYGNYLRSNEEEKDAQRSFMEATKGVIETNPFAYTFQTFSNALDSKKAMNQFIFDEAFGQWIPYSAAVRKIGEWRDTDLEGKTIKRVPDDNDIIQGFEDRMKIATGIGRNTVKEKDEKKLKKAAMFKESKN